MRQAFGMKGRYFQMGGDAMMGGEEAMQDPSGDMMAGIMTEDPALAEQSGMGGQGQFAPEIQALFDSLTDEQKELVMQEPTPEAQEALIQQFATENGQGAQDPAAMGMDPAAMGMDPAAAGGMDPMAAMGGGMPPAPQGGAPMAGGMPPMMRRGGRLF